MRLIKRFNQRGDTIVEVLIAIAVISSVLGTSYAIVNRNSKSYQQVSERTEALKLAEDQLEQLRGGITVPAGDFCVLPGGEVKIYSASSCTFNSRYEIRITPGPVFNVHVEWDGINGTTDKLDLKYRV